MTVDISNEKRELLKKFVLDISSSFIREEDIKDYAGRLADVYSDDFRHSYADFFPLIVEIAKDEKRTLENITANLESLGDYFLSEEDPSAEFDSLRKNFQKLRDHLSLEIGRFNYYHTSEEQFENSNTQVEKLRSEVTDLRGDLKTAQNQLTGVQTNLISVLSIFAAIVLAFSGNLSFTGNVLSGISQNSFFRAAFFVLLCGLVSFNLIFLLLYMVGKLTGRNIYARCKTEDCSCSKPCYGIKRIRKRLPYVYWMNFLLLLLLFLDVAAWVANKFWYGEFF